MMIPDFVGALHGKTGHELAECLDKIFAGSNDADDPRATARVRRHRRLLHRGSAAMICLMFLEGDGELQRELLGHITIGAEAANDLAKDRDQLRKRLDYYKRILGEAPMEVIWTPPLWPYPYRGNR